MSWTEKEEDSVITVWEKLEGSQNKAALSLLLPAVIYATYAVKLMDQNKGVSQDVLQNQGLRHTGAGAKMSFSALIHTTRHILRKKKNTTLVHVWCVYQSFHSYVGEVT